MKNKLSISFLFTVLVLLGFAYPAFADTADNSSLLNTYSVPKGIYEITANSPYSKTVQQINVSDVSGSLKIKQTDLVLPGRNGLDVNLTRIYFSNESNLYTPKAITHATAHTNINYRVYATYDIYENYNGTNTYMGQNTTYMDFGTNKAAADAYVYPSFVDTYVNPYHYYQYLVAQWEVSYDNPYYTYQYENSTDAYTYDEQKCNLGSGWSFDFPSVEISGSYKYLHLTDGSVYRILSDNSLEGYPLSNITFANTTETVGTQTASYKVTDTVGRSVYYDSTGNWIGTKDAYGNQITVSYVLKPINGGTQYQVIDKIVDTIGRTIQFTYNTNSVTVSYSGKSIVYNKTALANETNEMVLSSYVNEMGETTTYTYDKKSSTFDFDTSDSQYPVGTMQYAALTDITYPTGSKTSFNYQFCTENLGNIGTMGYYQVTTQYDTINSIIRNMIEYTYDTNNYSGYPVYRTPDSLPTGFIYTNITKIISDPDAASPKPYSLKISKTFNNKHLNTVTVNLKENQYQSQQSRSYNSTTKLMESNTYTAYDLVNSTNSSTSESYTYDNYGNVLTHTDPKGHLITYTYSSVFPSIMVTEKTTVGTVQVKYIEQSVDTVKPQVNWQKVHYNDENGVDQNILTTYTYDSYGNATQVATNLEGSKQKKIDIGYTSDTSYTYPSWVKTYATSYTGVLETIENRFEYDTGTGRLSAFIDGKTVQSGNINSNTKYNYAYDNIGRTTGITFPLVAGEAARSNKSASYTIDSVNQQASTKVIDEEGNIVKTIYDGIGNPIYIQKQDNNSNLVTFKTMHYNRLGQLDYVIDGDNNTTSYEYDAVGRKTKTIFANNNTIQIVYDDVNRKVTTIDENGNKTVAYMDEIGRQTKTDRVDVANNKTVTTTTDYEYNGDPFQTRIVDYNSKATVYKNNGLNLLSKVTQNVNGIDQMTNYKYNNLGLVTQKILADNTTINYSYDETERLLSETNQQQLVVWNQYDLNNNLIKNTDKNGVAANLSYDEQNRLTQQIKGTLTTSYTYYKNNLRKTMVDSTGTTQYTYYKDNLLQQITFPDLKTIQYEYDTAGNRTKLTEPFTQVWNYNYDQQNRLDYMTIGASQTMEIDINYKPNGLIDMATQANGMKAIYSFDGLNRLTGLAHKNSAGTVVGSYGYTNDNNGNILTKTENGTTNTFTYDEVNRILTNTQGNEIYTYDKTGNRATLSATSSFITDDTMDYTYDEYNRLIQVKKNDVIISTNKYNGDGLLVEQTENGVTTRYYYDGANIIAEGTVAVNGTVSLKARYLRAGTQLVSKEDNTGLKGYYLQNGHGDVVELRNTAGNVLASYTYDIWGNPLTVNESGMTSLFRYSGELWDSTVSLQYLRARWYDPATSRMLTEDSYPGDPKDPLSLNLYTYCGNDPVNNIDPSGHMPVYALRGVSALYNSGALNASLTSTFALVANGFGAYTAFHEIAQLNIARKLNEMGYGSTLEYSITSKTDKNWLGNYKKYEADIVSGNMAWEVKPLGTDGTAQLQKYMTDGNLAAGFTMDPITNIPVFDDYKMGIVFNAPGMANYYFYKLNEKGEPVIVPAVELKKEYNKRAAGAVVVAGVIMAATLAEDVGTAGVGVADDVPSLIGALGAASAILAH